MEALNNRPYQKEWNQKLPKYEAEILVIPN